MMFFQETWDRKHSSTCWAWLRCRPVVIESGNRQLIGCFGIFWCQDYLFKCMFTSCQTWLYIILSGRQSWVLSSLANWEIVDFQWFSNSRSREVKCVLLQTAPKILWILLWSVPAIDIWLFRFLGPRMVPMGTFQPEGTLELWHDLSKMLHFAWVKLFHVKIVKL